MALRRYDDESTKEYLARLESSATPGSAHPFWYHLIDQARHTKSGNYVTPDNAMEVSAVYACVTLLSETIASLPLKIYTETDSGKEEKREGKLYNLLQNPVGYQNQFEWMENLVGFLALRGNSYHRIGPLRSELDPIHPDRIQPELLDNRTILYTVRNEDGTDQEFDQSEILHIKGLASDGVRGWGTVTLARETIGVAKAAEEHGGKFFGNSSIPGGIISVENKLDPESKKRLRQDFEKMHSGDNQYRVGVFDTAMKWQQVGLSNEDAQFLETRSFQVADIARWFRIPPHMIGDVERSTSWGTGIEQQSIGFVRYTLRPWLKRIETAINSSLVLPNDGNVYVKFAVEGLLRGDSAARASFYSTMKSAMIMTTNEIRALEDMNPIEGGDQLENPATSTSSTSGQDAEPEPEPQEDNNARATKLMLDAAADNLVSCESNAHEARLKHASEDPDRFRKWHEGWMKSHRSRVEKALKPAWELNSVDESSRSGMVDNYILARSGAILSHSDDAWKVSAVSLQLEKDLKQWKS